MLGIFLEEIEKAETVLGNSVLTDKERKNIILESFESNLHSNQLYKVMFDYFMDDVDNISELAEYFGCDINGEKEKKAYAFLMENIGTTDYNKVGLYEYENLPLL